MAVMQDVKTGDFSGWMRSAGMLNFRSSSASEAEMVHYTIVPQHFSSGEKGRAGKRLMLIEGVRSLWHGKNLADGGVDRINLKLFKG